MSPNESEIQRSPTNQTIGGLAIYVVSDAKTWHGVIGEIDRYLTDFVGSDWDALFCDVLKCKTPEPDLDGQISRAEYRAAFQRSIPSYQMLGRIWDMYEDVGYEANEIIALRDECLRVRSNATNPEALKALAKLLFACNEALKSNHGLFLVSD